MKYHFVYDEAYLALKELQLSDEECRVVLATVVGNHNALFYGYKPERLVRLIKKLSLHMRFAREGAFTGFIDVDDKPYAEQYVDFCDSAKDGGVYVNGIDNMSLTSQTKLAVESVNATREFQLIATTTDPGYLIEPLLNNFDIVYKCNCEGISVKTTENLIETLKKTIRHREGLTSGQNITGRFTDGNRCFGDSNVHTLYYSESRTKPISSFKFLKVARSFADMDGENLVLLKHYNHAKELYKA